MIVPPTAVKIVPVTFIDGSPFAKNTMPVIKQASAPQQIKVLTIVTRGFGGGDSLIVSINQIENEADGASEKPDRSNGRVIEGQHHPAKTGKRKTPAGNNSDLRQKEEETINQDDQRHLHGTPMGVNDSVFSVKLNKFTRHPMTQRVYGDLNQDELATCGFYYPDNRSYYQYIQEVFYDENDDPRFQLGPLPEIEKETVDPRLLGLSTWEYNEKMSLRYLRGEMKLAPISIVSSNKLPLK